MGTNLSIVYTSLVCFLPFQRHTHTGTRINFHFVNTIGRRNFETEEGVKRKRKASVQQRKDDKIVKRKSDTLGRIGCFGGMSGGGGGGGWRTILGGAVGVGGGRRWT